MDRPKWSRLFEVDMDAKHIVVVEVRDRWQIKVLDSDGEIIEVLFADNEREARQMAFHVSRRYDFPQSVQESWI